MFVYEALGALGRVPLASTVTIVLEDGLRVEVSEICKLDDEDEIVLIVPVKPLVRFDNYG